VKDFELLRALANALIDGTATPADAERLSALLRDQPELRDDYLSYLDTHAVLCWEFRDLAGAAASAAAPSGSVGNGRRWKIASWFPWLVSGLAAAVALVAVLRPGNQGQPSPGAVHPTPPADSIVALLVDETGAEFAPEHGPQGVRLGPGTYELRRGIVHLRFAQGADVVLAGPARLDVRDAQHIRLANGKVRVTAPPTAQGFTVATRAVDYVDLGTEFGLRVDAESGTSDLYVFDGQVNVADPRSGKVLSEVLVGKSSRSIAGKLTAAPPLKESDFPSPGSIGLKRWEAYERERLQDPGLLAFYPFRRSADESVLVNGVQGDPVAHGRVVGARWTTGRWPGKGALLFDRDTDFAQIDIPGEHQELTMAAWLKVERLDYVYSAILNSDGYDLGKTHLQLTRQGFPRGGVAVHGNFQDRVEGRPVPLGKWAHVALVISASNRCSQIYVNGQLSRERHWRGEQVIRPGSCRLGNWLPHPKEKDEFKERAFRGQIDELAIWSRALAREELERLVKAGQPRLLWSEE